MRTTGPWGVGMVAAIAGRSTPWIFLRISSPPALTPPGPAPGGAAAPQLRADPFLLADQDQGEAVGAGRLDRPAHDFPRGVVPPHRIHCNFHRMDEVVSPGIWP